MNNDFKERRQNNRREIERRENTQPLVLEWSEKFSTGVRAIDNDHKELFDEFAALNDQFNKSPDETAISGMIKSLSRYVTEHFKREEMFMERAHYPELKAHKKKHYIAAEQIFELEKIYLEAPDTIDGQKVVRFLSDWLCSHILGADMKFVPYLQGDATEDDAAENDGKLERIQEMQTVEILLPEDMAEAVQKYISILSKGDRTSGALMEVVNQMVSRNEVITHATAVKLFCKEN